MGRLCLWRRLARPANWLLSLLCLLSQFLCQIPGLPFKFDVAVPQRRLVCIAESQCARFSGTEEAETSDPMLEVGDIEPDLVVAVPTAPLVVKIRNATQGRASDFEVQEFVVGKAKASTSPEQSSRRDAGSAGGRRLIRRLCTHAGYRSVKHQRATASTSGRLVGTWASSHCLTVADARVVRYSMASLLETAVLRCPLTGRSR